MTAAVALLGRCHQAGIGLAIDGDRLVADVPENVPGELVAELRARKPELFAHLRLLRHIEQACAGVTGITPAQFEALLSDDDREWIGSGRYEVMELRCFAYSFAEGIAKGRIRFDAAGHLIEHGLFDPVAVAV